MCQTGGFDISTRHAGLDAKADPLVTLSAMVPWEGFRPRLEAVWRRSSQARTSRAGRKPWDAVVIFKALSYDLAHSLDRSRTQSCNPNIAKITLHCSGLEQRTTFHMDQKLHQ